MPNKIISTIKNDNVPKVNKYEINQYKKSLNERNVR